MSGTFRCLSVNCGSVGRWVSLGIVLLSTSACVTRAQYDRLVTEYHSENQARMRMESELAKRNTDMSTMRGQLDTARRDAMEAKSMGTDRIAQLEAALTAAQNKFSFVDGDLEVFMNDEGFTILARDDLLFDSGSMVVRERGRAALAAVAKEIVGKGYPEVRIDGHTDSDPVVRTLEINPLGNHELAAKRALAVYGILKDEGVEEGILSLSSFGPNRPLVSESSAEDKARNRRVEIHVRVPSN